MLTLWVIFQVFALFLARREPLPLTASTGYWLQPLVFWTLIAAQFPLLFAIVPDTLLTDPSGQSWHAADLLQTLALVSVFTMLFVAVLGFILLWQQRESA